MEKTFNFFVIFLLLIVLSSCETKSVNYELSKDISIISKVSIYYVEEIYDEGNIHFLISENNPVYTLSKEQEDYFLVEICSLVFEREVVYFPIPMDGGCDIVGYVFIIIYEDGSYEMIAENGQFSYIY